MCIQFCARFWIDFGSILVLKINKNQLQIETDKAIKNKCEGMREKAIGRLRDTPLTTI